jgi:RNA polymerase sigma factor (sigma-70 family)
MPEARAAMDTILSPWTGAILKCGSSAAQLASCAAPAPAEPRHRTMSIPASASTADEDCRDIVRVLGGEREAFSALVDRHQGRIIGHLTRLVGRDAAEDLAQEAFVRAYQALPRYDATYPFRGWLLVIATRLAVNHGARRREQPLGEAIGEHGRQDDPGRELGERDALSALVRRIDAALDRLTPEARALYELRFRQELSINALACHFAVSTNALKVRIHRLRTQLAELLGLDAPT